MLPAGSPSAASSYEESPQETSAHETSAELRPSAQLTSLQETSPHETAASEESPQEQTDQAGLYTLIHVIDMVENKEIDYWIQLRTIELGSRTLSLASKPMIAEALVRARAEGEAINGLSAALLGSLRTAGSGRPGIPGASGELRYAPVALIVGEGRLLVRAADPFPEDSSPGWRTSRQRKFLATSPTGPS